MKAGWAAVAAAVLLAVLGCTGDPAADGGQTQPRPGAGQEKKVDPPAPEANQPGPQKDPKACNDRGAREVEVQAHYTSEVAKDTPRRLTWSLNGVVTPATNIKGTVSNGPARGYGNEWSRLVSVKCGDVVGVAMEGSPSFYAVICHIVDLGDGPLKTGERNCSVTYTVV